MQRRLASILLLSACALAQAHPARSRAIGRVFVSHPAPQTNTCARPVAEDWFTPAFGDWEVISPGWWRRHTVNMELEPAATSARLDEPVLWFFAENDENVPYRESAAALQKAAARNPGLTVITVHDAFLVPDGAGGLRYTDEYWGRMATWLEQHVHW